MGRPRKNSLPKYLEFNSRTRSFYYKHPGMRRKASFGNNEQEAVDLACLLNSRYRIEREREAARTEAAVDLSSPQFDSAIAAFVDKYVTDYRLKPSTAVLLRQRQIRLSRTLAGVQVAALDTCMLREAISGSSQHEQGKMKTLLARFFSFAKSTGMYPPHLVNPVDDLFVDPLPAKRRQRMTTGQFRAIYGCSPPWLRWLMTLGLHLALRRVDLVSLRFDDVSNGRIVSAIRKTETDAREIDATSVDFPLHPDLRRVIAESRRSSLSVGRCPFIVHRAPERRTRRLADALAAGRLEHIAQVTPDHASKAFRRARDAACRTSDEFDGLVGRQLPTLHEIRALSSHLYAAAGYDVASVQDLMAHTDPDMTRAYQKGHARKILRVDMLLPLSVDDQDGGVRESAPVYAAAPDRVGQEKFSENFLTAIARSA